MSPEPTEATSEENFMQKNKKNAVPRGTLNYVLNYTGAMVPDEDGGIDIEGLAGVGFHFPTLDVGDIIFEVKEHNSDTWQGVWKDIDGTVLQILATTGDFSIWIKELMPFHKLRVRFSVNQTIALPIDGKA